MINQSTFNTPITRLSTASEKWDGLEHFFGVTDALPMWVADMDFAAPPSVIEALQTRVGHGVFGYTLQSDAYQAAVISWMERRHNWKIQSDWMVFTPGIVPALSIAVQQFTSPGDAVVIQTPVYPPFYDVVRGQGRELVTNPLLEKQGQYTMDLEHLEASFQTGKIKMLILCSPHNPVGRVWTREELEELASLCLKYNVLIVSDEIHADLIYERGAHTPLSLISEEIANYSIICTAPSKTFNIPGLCTSNIIIANTDLRERFALGVRTMGLSSISTFGAAATEAAYDGGEEWLDQCLTYIRGNMEYVQQYITEHIPGINVLLPEATYLLWVDFRGLGMTHAELTRKLLHEAKLAFNDGAVFGAESAGFMRINVACSRATVEEAMRRLSILFNK
ncbi:MalY/PatB family protein [Paenibacillus silvae]|uniref:MalY/PatB family protein n=1 Tax=Paenibacillus silvae TaxID=1325358 RepID=UPI0020045A45|nr:MalY/PatB family protein [Paenibacillus silvae]MCK6077769.1 pyridoxal phosphate-dependent aminotransferase [Paenibacillus silvae]MCK6151968.1 pyridoxal phosphate-dependent aminotransferase [Paenibacillus silvae]MCK6270653.1 pyridoxal phosphate-dependent aminotransferase [Paenibacillus silvae]